MKKLNTQSSDNFYLLVYLFLIGAFIGDLIETIFMYITTGKLVNRSSLIYGQFSIVWGLGIVLLTISLYKYKEKKWWIIFLIGSALGGIYEYLCSVFTEAAFGTVFWDYSKLPFNLFGRINLLFCGFWGIIALLWIKLAYPHIEVFINKLYDKTGRIVVTVCIVLIIFDMLLSSMALSRYYSRTYGVQPQNPVEAFIDTHYPDERMQSRYPYARIVKTENNPAKTSSAN